MHLNGVKLFWFLFLGTQWKPILNRRLETEGLSDEKYELTVVVDDRLSLPVSISVIYYQSVLSCELEQNLDIFSFYIILISFLFSTLILIINLK